MVCRRGFALRAGLLACWPQCETAEPDLEITSGDGTAALRHTCQSSWPLGCPGAGPRLAFILSCNLRAFCLHLCLPAHCTENSFDFWLELLVGAGNLWHRKKANNLAEVMPRTCFYQSKESRLDFPHITGQSHLCSQP